MKKEKRQGQKAASASIRLDKSGLLGNRLLPAVPHRYNQGTPL